MSVLLATKPSNETWGLIAFKSGTIKRLDKYVPPCTDRQEIVERARIRIFRDPELRRRYAGWTIAPVDLTAGHCFIVRGAE